MTRSRKTTAKTKKITPKIDERAALTRVTRLMAIPGKSGFEREAAEWIRKQLLVAGAKRSQISFDSANRKSPFLDGGGNCGNLIFKLPGTLPGPRRLLMAHMDTVPLCEGSKPVRRGGRLVSGKKDVALGADDRTGCATLLTAALEIMKRKLPHPPLTFMWTIQEEVGLYGARFCSPTRLGNPKLVFNWDGGTPDTVTVGATGAYDISIVVHGVASHAGGRPEEGVSAAAIFALAVSELKKNGWHGLIRKNGKRGTSNIGVIRGGDATNVVMDRLEIEAEGRAHDRKFRKRIIDAYRKAFERAARKVKSTLGKRGRISFKATFSYESFELGRKTPGVLEAERAVASVGLKSKRVICNGGLDANWMTARGLPAVTMGLGNRHAHKVAECTVIREYFNACRIALFLATGGSEQP